MIKNFLVRQQNFVVPHRADIVQPRHVFRQQNGSDARHRLRGGSIAFENLRPRVRRANRPDFEHVPPCAKIIRVNGFARDVFVRAFVGDGALINTGL